MTPIYCLIRSGIEEEVNEMDYVLRTVAELMNEFKNLQNKNKNTKSYENSLYQKGFEARETATQEMDLPSISYSGGKL